MSVLGRLTSDILPKAALEGKLGHDIVKFLDFIIDGTFQAANYVTSTIYFGDLILETKDRNHVSRSVVIKTYECGKLYEAADKFAFNLSLHNEILFYTEILPLFEKCDPRGTIAQIFPKCILAHADHNDPTNDVLIFENAQKQGFRSSPWKHFNDYKHIKLTVTWLGKFHAMSLLCKEKCPEEFAEIMSKISETHFNERRLANPDNFFQDNCRRGILPLQNDPNYESKLEDLLALVERVDHSVAKMITPREPLAVLTHGDFTTNNIFYKYDSKNEPCAVMFFDWASIRYSSPVTDFTHYLFVHSSPLLKAHHWDDIFRTYYLALTSNPLLDPKLRPSFEELRLDLRRRGFLGYVYASFLLPKMLAVDEEPKEEWFNLTLPEITELRLATGGEVATTYVTEIVKFMIEHDFDFKYMLNLKMKE
ncbi:uncharacterized protein [Bemisia tabaci]|uniref:uncharacterized protein n=1 Tax=Bemisia tabaci TaxID=7038 RepID=UPI003B27EB0C